MKLFTKITLTITSTYKLKINIICLNNIIENIIVILLLIKLIIIVMVLK